MKASYKIVAYFSSVLALLSAILTYMSTGSMGFPDGHLTELELAIKPLFIGYSIVALLFGMLFYIMARVSSKKYSWVVFYFSFVLFILLVVGLVTLYFYFGSTLNDGGGA